MGSPWIEKKGLTWSFSLSCRGHHGHNYNTLLPLLRRMSPDRHFLVWSGCMQYKGQPVNLKRNFYPIVSIWACTDKATCELIGKQKIDKIKGWQLLGHWALSNVHATTGHQISFRRGSCYRKINHVAQIKTLPPDACLF